MSIYLEHFGLQEPPFAITPDPRYVYLSQRHEDALAHLLYGIGQGGSGGFVQLTGEVGTGKTTLCRCLLEQIPEKTRIALVLNPMLKPRELLQAICDELQLPHGRSETNHELVNRLYQHLLTAHANGERVVLVIDEAQNMARDSLEQVRLLTNLETHTDKLLQIILLGQPELRELLARKELRQLAQRITARYHLQPLDAEETEAYVKHRLAVAGCRRPLFKRGAYHTLYRLSGGVPRLINIICDRALLGAYAGDSSKLNSELLRQAAREVCGDERRQPTWFGLQPAAAGALAAVLLLGAGYTAYQLWPRAQSEPALADATLSSEPASDAGQPQPPPQPNTANADATADTAAPAVGVPLATGEMDTAADYAGAGVTLGDWLNAAQAAPVWSRWADVWQLEAHRITTACEGAETDDAEITGVFCTRQPGGWSRIRQLDLPVLIELGNSDAPLLVEGLDGGQVLLHNGATRHWWPVSELRDDWSGGYTAVCPGATGAWRAGMQGAEIQRFKQLAQDLPEQPYQGVLDEQYDESFTAWVAGFQTRNGLVSDGILGQESKLFLCAASSSAPRLLTSFSMSLLAEGE